MLIRSAAVGDHGRSSFRPLAGPAVLIMLMAAQLAASPAAQAPSECRDNLRERVCIETDAQGRLAVTTRPLEALPETLPALSVELRPLFSQRQPILDVLDVAGQRIVLDRTAISTYTRGEAGWRLDHATALTAPIPWPRDLRGHLTRRGDSVQAQLPALTCVGAAAPDAGRFTCEPGQPAAIETPRADDEVTILDECRRAPYALVRVDADGGSDALGVFDVRNRTPNAAPSRVLQGRLTALWASGSGDAATAVVRALDADRYDAYQIRLACVR